MPSDGDFNFGIVSVEIDSGRVHVPVDPPPLPDHVIYESHEQNARAISFATAVPRLKKI
jgi:hypothetical protein